MILIMASADDAHTQSVVAELHKMGQTGVRVLDFRDFPQRMAVSMEFSGIAGTSTAGGDFVLDLAGESLRMSQVRSVWWRRPQEFGIPLARMPADAGQFAMSETTTAFRGMWQCSEALWVNHIVRDAAAAHKPWQLQLASEAGLNIPETLITTDPARARAFWEARSGQVIYKPFNQSVACWRETRQLKAEDLGQLELVRLAPVLFQGLVPLAADLRVTIIGDEVFPAALDGRKMDYKLDVRFNEQAYEKHRLPVPVEEKLLALMDRLGLEYGAIDLRLRPDGEYVFFEVNPAGQFLFVEHACGLPISRALAAHLARGRPARRAAASGKPGCEIPARAAERLAMAS
jgi:glutathione synthase/RimK-type ligase-like ATP-grasp enzyme